MLAKITTSAVPLDDSQRYTKQACAMVHHMRITTHVAELTHLHAEVAGAALTGHPATMVAAKSTIAAGSDCASSTLVRVTSKQARYAQPCLGLTARQPSI